MIEWRDEGALLKVRKHGENSAIIEVFTQTHGKAAGIVRGGTSRKIAPLLQPGAQLDVTWKARLENHLGSFTIEPVRSRAAQVMQDRLALAGLNAVTGILAFVLPERETHPPLYDRTIALLDLLGQNEVWPLAYLQWEIALLEEMGFALDLSACAVSGLNDDLFYVSPRTGRAVSRLAAGEWADRLLALPKVMLGKGDADIPDILIALKTTGHFLHHHLAKSLGDRPLPDARQRLIDVLKRST
ncbi:DNA repair protein RecO [Octadecabacter sp. 1_MG-2023]|uniref:DNA repair protein RecO n=1 Tax=unclassified Octadecabacter TaxID=196158 RepID=UPI001C09C2BB|nr:MULTISPECIES: DNA repair protein RecO [unclassified Octadecabacter]MBU2992614.1 DNA repair protein RecO [Octadecabacter sp. B2R22]MDO6734629.1 DNA repair protein RecO [Octadecabacter sp. 1_MG-2023]